MNLRTYFDAFWDGGIISRDIPDFISENLNPKFQLRAYQKKAIARFIYYYSSYNLKVKPIHLLFHMATGSGKTLLMAANIIYLFKQGYRNFIYFVNSNNIIEKTKDNFLNKQSSKYLFNQKIIINGKEVLIKKVQNFEVANQDEINIFFTTVQNLHSLMSAQRENVLTYEDFKDKQIVMISDEAHHINAWTKNKLSRSENEAKKTWEHTITSLFRTNKNNIMIEYTATVDLSEPSINDKYENKIIYEYTLKDFRKDRYSKEVKVLQADLTPIDRALQAVILSQYRRKVAETFNKYIKPVILMKSKTIAESKKFKKEFIEKIHNLRPHDLEILNNRNTEENVLKRAFSFFEKESITMANLVAEIKEEFDENRYLLLDTDNISEEKQLKVNSLEDKSNEIRVIFAVDMLNEGWDVLNLYDIVRLYNTRDAKANRPGTTTIREAQLIGRGARYFPFQITDDQDKYKRKYDKDLNNDLRVLEELYYHSANNPRYIQELTIALKETGIIPQFEPLKINLKVKDSFKKSNLWKNGFVFINRRELIDRSEIKDLSEYITPASPYKHKFFTGDVSSITVFESNGNVKIAEKEEIRLKLNQFNHSILRKAIDKIDFFKFSNLKKYAPAMNSISEFIQSLSELNVEVSGPEWKINNLTADDKLEIAISVLERIKNEIETKHTKYRGTKIFIPYKISEIATDKVINVLCPENWSSDQERGRGMIEARNDDLRMDLKTQDWYIYEENYGTADEKYLICFIKSMIKKLEKMYSNIYLLRNEKPFQIYNFSDGRATEPDFVLFLKDRTSEKTLLYQLFIEAKGSHLLNDDNIWKEKFLKEIEKECKVEILMENTKFKIIGMPFYTKETENIFIEAFNNKLKLNLN